MNKSVDISNFQKLSIPEKIDFLSGEFLESIKSLDEKTLNSVLRGVVLDSKENPYVRKSALELFTELVILGKVKTRHAYSLLIDDWVSDEDIFLELQRLKDLLLYYEPSSEESCDIEAIFKKGTGGFETEITSECLFNLGIISLTKAFGALNENEYKINLEKGEHYFQKSFEGIENRVDSKFYQKVILILKELVSNKWDSAILYIKELANNLFQKEIFSFNYDFDNLQYGFYKMLTSLQQICIQQPKDWIDYKLELDKVYLNYTEITNSKITTRLNEKSLIEKIGAHFKDRILEPFFAINLSSEVTKIDVLLRDITEGSSEWNFLKYLKSIIQDTDKKKVEYESIELEFKKLFPNQSSQVIDKVISNVNKPTDFIRAFGLLTQKNNENLLGHLMFACSKLQGDKKYWGNNVNENDRNRYIATLLESAGYTIKDQPQWSISTEGKDSGEIDVFVTEPNGAPKSIIEALILDSLKQDYLILHLDKLFRYDTTGLENNYIITYSLAKNFNSFWTRYHNFISKYDYEYKFLEFKELDKYNYADIKIGVAQHLRNGKKINLYHLMINLVER
ncbi:hypothetical protein [Marinifilum flexuosum]|uniref:hypothetical protein n=1 Tax=Marinifilum flexuosum TaxID=1117708 RepID=UPI002494CFF5|nr:hypothetical protein [Marinifilum flexuosum]